jgi:hypothetical protein
MFYILEWEPVLWITFILHQKKIAAHWYPRVRTQLKAKGWEVITDKLCSAFGANFYHKNHGFNNKLHDGAK